MNKWNNQVKLTRIRNKNDHLSKDNFQIRNRNFKFLTFTSYMARNLHALLGETLCDLNDDTTIIKSFLKLIILNATLIISSLIRGKHENVEPKINSSCRLNFSLLFTQIPCLSSLEMRNCFSLRHLLAPSNQFTLDEWKNRIWWNQFSVFIIGE